jgi:hypothetical protein
MEENNEYYINKAEVKCLDENGFVENRDLKGFYKKALSVTGAGSAFLQDNWFRSIIEIAAELDLGVSFSPTILGIETVLNARLECNCEIGVDGEVMFRDREGFYLCRFSIAELQNCKQVASIIKSFKSAQ